MKKKLLIALALAVFFFVGFAHAQSPYYSIVSHTIDMEIDEYGFASISEKFFLQFPTDAQLQEFRQKNAEIGISLEAWKEFDSRIFPHIGNENELNRAEVSFVENNAKYLEIKYSLNTPIAEKTGETSRMTEFSLLSKFLGQFLQGGAFIIPENTSISVQLPSFAEIQSPIKPEAAVSANSVTWQGYKSSNVLQLNYRIVKQIASINLSESIAALTSSPLFLVFVIIAVIIVAIVLQKRKKISEKIENFIVENSQLGGKEEALEEEKGQ